MEIKISDVMDQSGNYLMGCLLVICITLVHFWLFFIEGLVGLELKSLLGLALINAFSVRAIAKSSFSMFLEFRKRKTIILEDNLTTKAEKKDLGTFRFKKVIGMLLILAMIIVISHYFSSYLIIVGEGGRKIWYVEACLSGGMLILVLPISWWTSKKFDARLSYNPTITYQRKSG